MEITSGHNLREKINIYGGPVVGGGYTLTAFRYMIAPPYDGSALSEILSWSSALIAGSPFIFVGTLTGVAVGMMGAFELKHNRIKKSELEKKVE